MRFLPFVLLLSLGTAPMVLHAQAAKPAAAAASSTYSIEDTEFGAILDDPAAKAIVEKHVPGMTTNEQADMARGMTLRGIQQYVPDQLTDARLAAIQAEFAQLPKK